MAHSPKVCSLCGQDCSDRARVKDKQGRYICGLCEDRRTGRAAPASDPDALPLDLEPDQPGPDQSISVCPGCGSALGPGIAVCVRCGYDRRAGLASALTDDAGHPALKCRSCGYNLAGLKASRCPECGASTIPRPGRRGSSTPPATGWRKPLILIIVAILLTAALQIPFDRSGATFARSMLGLLLKIPISVIAYSIAGLFWMGFDMPWRHVWLRYAAVCAVGTLLGVPVGVIPFIFAQAGIMIFIYFALIARLLDVDVQDAIIIASFTVVANLILVQAALIAVMGA